MLFVVLLNFSEKAFLNTILLSLKRRKLNLYYPSPNVFKFLQGSKKISLLKKVMEGNQHYGNGQKIVFNICVTRWVENVDGYERFLSAIAYIVEALEVIAHKMHLEKYPDWGVWGYCITDTCKCMFRYLGPVSIKCINVIIKCHLESRWSSLLKNLLGIRFEKHIIFNQKTNLIFSIGINFAHHF